MAVKSNELAPLYMWVVYERPLDYPNSYVARLWRTTTAAVATQACFIAQTLEDVRRMLPLGLTQIPREPTDEPQIVEVWL